MSKAGKRKDSGQQGQTRQPLRSHQVCRDTLEHSEPDGICPPGVRSRPDDIQTQGQARKEEWRMSHVAYNAQYVLIICMHF